VHDQTSQGSTSFPANLVTVASSKTSTTVSATSAGAVAALEPIEVGFGMTVGWGAKKRTKEELFRRTMMTSTRSETTTEAVLESRTVTVKKAVGKKGLSNEVFPSLGKEEKQ
jgi:hypothetical protein